MTAVLPSLLALGITAQAHGQSARPVHKVAALNVIQAENRKPGTTDWLLTKVEEVAGDRRDDRYRHQRAIEGYVSHTSIRAGQELTAFVSTQPTARYRVAVFRMGHYEGKGARLMTTLGPFTGTPQPDPIEGDKQLMEARWQLSFRLLIPRDWPSGVYVAKMTTEGSGYQSYLLWVVRDDRKSHLMFQVSDLTWQAYNRWPVTYVSNLDTHSDPDGLLRVKGFLSVGHDEYWTRKMVENVARARDHGVSLGFLSGNSVDGEVSLEPASDGRPDRVFGRFEGRGADEDFDDEHLLMGSTSYGVGLGDWTVTLAEHWLFEGTGIKSGDRIPGLVGWEFHGPPFGTTPL